MIVVSIASEMEIEDIIELFYQIDLHYFADRAPSKDEIAEYVRRNLFQDHVSNIGRVVMRHHRARVRVRQRYLLRAARLHPCF